MEKINHKSNIWDLHLHTCQCSKPSKEFGELTVTGYVDKLLEIYKSYPNLSMISFTDHNKISTEVYIDFMSKCDFINVIPGVEIDVQFSKEETSKHLLVYFDNSIIDIIDIAEKVNTILESYKVSDKNPIDFSTLVEKLVDAKFTFLLSPHAFKQTKRGINHEWVDEYTSQKSRKYANQFFCFWETSGYKEINNAKIYMQDFLEGKEQSIVSFSDSSTFNSILSYLDNPPIYFNSLNTFRGIQLVGTDSSRLTPIFEELSTIQKSKLIGSIYFENDVIDLSSRLNSIIGGRGSGKSILIDKIATKTKSKGLISKQSRIEFLDNYSCNLFDMNNNPISNDFEIDYFNQSYVSKIFDGKNTNDEIQKYFSKEFESVTPINIESIIHSIKSSFNEKVNGDAKEIIKGNIGDLISSYVYIDDTDLGISLLKKNIEECSFIDDFDLDKQKTEIKKTNIIPKQILNEEKVKNAIHTFQESIVVSINEYNLKLLDSVYLKNMIITNFSRYKEEKSTESKLQASTEKLVKYKINIEFSKYIERVKLVNAILEIENSEKFTYINESGQTSVELAKIYRFTKELIIERPIDFFLRIVSSYVSKSKYKTPFTFSNFISIAKDYCFNLDSYLNPSKTMTELDAELKNFEIITNIYNRIYYNGKLIDDESPGTKTNILMEYIVNSRNEIPLLIDQPEDNIDNHTIYNKLTDWFSKLKINRQIIVVSHDANIVINSDSENLIIANQESECVFKYSYGALEYGRNLDEAALILDGGVKAVKRRLNKYGDE
ncbi:MAG: hypothetical protein KKH92_09735 [Firmicutes bacterium]|nr:hypothetical protein [Bacillota bacterium]